MSALECERSMKSYLYSGKGGGKRKVLSDILKELAEHIPETVIFGGMPREFSLGNARGFSSDIDLVSLHDDLELEGLISKFLPVKNKFGGYRFSAGGWYFDLWSLKNTWAVKQGLVEASGFSDLLKTTFFDIDAVAFHISDKSLLCAELHRNAAERRVLGMNLKKNPQPAAMARRAINMALMNGLALSRELATFVSENIRESRDDVVVQAVVSSIRRELKSRSDFIRPSVQSDMW